MTLQGKKILVTRAKAQASALSLKIEKYGGIPIVIPLITCEAIDDKTAIESVIKSIHTYQWIVFTSKNGIDYFMAELQRMKAILPPTCNIAVVGKKTKEVLETYGYSSNVIPDEFVAESLAEKLKATVKSNDRILIPKGNLARNVIADTLRSNSIHVTELDVYNTIIEKSSNNKLYLAIKNNELDVVTFTSSSTVNNFVRLLEGTDWRNYLKNIMFASIGPITSQTMKENNIPIHIEAKEYTIQGMLNAIMEKLKEE